MQRGPPPSRVPGAGTGGNGMSRLIFGWLTWLASSLPPWLGYALADLASGPHWYGFPERRHAVLANLAVILPRASRSDRVKIGKRMVRSYNRMMYEFFRLPHVSREELLAASELVGKEHLDRAIERGRGVIITSTHLGNWELGAVMVAQWGYALHAVAGVQLGRWLSGAVRDTKTELSITTIAPEDGFRKILRALEHNDPVALVVDGNLYQSGRARSPPCRRPSSATATSTITGKPWRGSGARRRSRPAPGSSPSARERS